MIKNSTENIKTNSSKSHRKKRPQKVREHLQKIRQKNKFTLASTVYRKLPLISGVCSILVGILVLIGWFLDITFLKSISENFASMKPNTASCFIFSGISLLIFYKNKTVFIKNIMPKVAFTLAFGVFLIGLLSLSLYIFGIESGVNYILQQEEILRTNSHFPWQMSASTALNFTLIGISLAVLSLKGSVFCFISQSLAAIAAFISLILFSGYFYNVDALYNLWFAKTTALHTTITFFILSIGILFVRPKFGLPRMVLKNSIGGLLVRRLIPAVLVFPFILNWTKQQGIQADLFENDFGIALVSSATILVIILLVLWTANSLDNVESQQKKTQKTVRESLKELADIKFALDESAIVAITDQKGRINYVNEFFCKISKYSREELVGKDHRIINSAYHSKEFIADLWKTIAKGEIWRGEIRNLAKDDSIYWVDTTIVPLLNELGKPYQYVAIRYDITNRKLAEEQISKESHFTDSLINSLPGIFYFFDINGRFLRWNDNFEETTGYSSEEISRLHPLDLFAENEKKYIEERIKEVFVKGESFAEANLISKDGKSTPYYFTGKKIQIENEFCLLGMGIDITERKIAEREMYKLASIVEHSDSAIISKNLDGTILSWNKGAEKIFGYTEKEILDKNIRLLIPPDHQNEEDEIIDRIKKSETIDSFETVRLKKDGTQFPILLTVSAINDKKGETIGVSKIATDISELIRAKNALQESELRYRELFENNPFPMWVYDLETLKFLAVNDSAEFYYGYTKEEFLSMTIKEIRPPEEIPALLENIEKNSGSIEKSGTWKHLKKDGTVIDVEISSHQINFDGKQARLVLSNDVTKRKRAEENLIESQRQIRELAESLPQLVWTCRGDGYCDYLSPQWVKYTGIPEDEQLGFKWLEQIHPEDRENTNSAWEKTVNKGVTFDVEFRIRRFDGVYRWFKTRAVPYKNAENEITRWFGTNTDIEESKQAEKKILLLNDTLENRVVERTAELEAANRELESFSYSVSHDLRAPLRAIDGFSRALLEDYSNIIDDEGKLYLNRVRAASQQMARLIEDLLTLSRVTRREIIRTKVDLSKIANEIVEILKERKEDRIVEFKIEDGIEANGDEGLLRIVLENLLENSWKFTSKNYSAEIIFGRKSIKGKFYYFVKDNGAGFDMKYADKLFGAFQRLHTVNEFDGTGIGLATVNRILLRHGGSIFAEGEVGKGATFYFII